MNWLPNRRGLLANMGATHCRACGKELRKWQERYCSYTCASRQESHRHFFLGLVVGIVGGLAIGMLWLL